MNLNPKSNPILPRPSTGNPPQSYPISSYTLRIAIAILTHPIQINPTNTMASQRDASRSIASSPIPSNTIQYHGIVDAVQSHPISSNPIPSHSIASHRRRYPISSYSILPNPIQPYPIAFDPIPSILPSWTSFFFKVFQRRLTSKNCGWIHESTLVVLYPKRYHQEPRTKLHCCLSDVWQCLAHNGFTLRVTRGDITWKEKTWREALSVRATCALA